MSIRSRLILKFSILALLLAATAFIITVLVKRFNAQETATTQAGYTLGIRVVENGQPGWGLISANSPDAVEAQVPLQDGYTQVSYRKNVDYFPEQTEMQLDDPEYQSFVSEKSFTVKLSNDSDVYSPPLVKSGERVELLVTITGDTVTVSRWTGNERVNLGEEGLGAPSE